jgi:hypothetical protein
MTRNMNDKTTTMLVMVVEGFRPNVEIGMLLHFVVERVASS